MIQKLTKWEMFEKASFIEKLIVFNRIRADIKKLVGRLTKENRIWDKGDYQSIVGLLWERQKEQTMFREISGVFSVENMFGSLGWWNLGFVWLLCEFFQFFFGVGIGFMS